MAKITKEEIGRRKEDYKATQYEHGGSRIFIDGEAGDRQLLVDTYYNAEFAQYIDLCVQRYFGIDTNAARVVFNQSINERIIFQLGREVQKAEK